ncbi:winged helix-turn-helix domain-containing protein [Halostagnicola sp. A-GB9-2]|uniref:ArsR/SmtB family transcription factor n=1 Tax=Halostagnicola sp. A-GB9-2 TaxID=3048066 RepID=UPI0024BF564D|nr:winged helix-turn-helix domain-containing protein [Halostagnicola sp. A-GB9-2]MDJ1434149.1 winged helix-turn-helix domain-containing protein [Halostagnicola sp. A-GB9-2]
MSLIDVLGNGTRLEILRELSREPMYVSELAEATGMDGKTAVHHLSTLEEAELVEWYMRGNRKYYVLRQSLELRIAPPPERTFVLQTEEIETETETAGQ